MISALQTFTIRNECRANLSEALANIKKIGFNAIELSRVEPNAQNASIINASGIKVLSLQVKYSVLRKNFDEVVDFLNATGCKIAEISVMRYSCIASGKRALLRFCSDINSLCADYKAKGITLSYHHHDFEFKKVGKTDKLQILLDNTFHDVKFVSDTYWSKVSGYEPQDVLNRIGDRLIGIHFRDYCEIDGKHKDCEVGKGLIDFNQVAKAGKYALYYAIEQKTDNPYKSIKSSLDFVQKNIVI